MNLAALHQKALNVMRNYFRKHGQLPILVLGLDPEQRLHLLAPSKDYFEKRDLYWDMMRSYFALHRVTAYAYASEMWLVMKRGKNLSALDGIVPSTDPDRIDSLVSGAVDHEAILRKIYRIIRTDGAPPQIGPEIVIPDGQGDRMEGPRVMLNGLLEGTDKADHEIDPIIKSVLELAFDSGYFREHRVLKPYEYESQTN